MQGAASWLIINKIDNDIMVLNQINLTEAFEHTLLHVFSYDDSEGGSPYKGGEEIGDPEGGELVRKER